MGKEIPVQEVKEPKKFILREKHVDKFTILRDRVELTPAICDVCALNLMENNKIKGEFDHLPDEMKVRIKMAVAEHKKAVHDPATQRIITEDQMPVAYLSEYVIRANAEEKLPDLYERFDINGKPQPGYNKYGQRVEDK